MNRIDGWCFTYFHLEKKKKKKIKLFLLSLISLSQTKITTKIFGIRRH